MQTGSATGDISSGPMVSWMYFIIAHNLGILTDDDISSLDSADSKLFLDTWNTCVRDLPPDQIAEILDGLTLEDAIALIENLSDEMIDAIRLDAGCIGLTSCYVQTAEQFRAAWIANLITEAVGGELLDNVTSALFAALRSQDLQGASFYSTPEAAQAALEEFGGTLFLVQGSPADGVPMGGPFDANSIVVGQTFPASDFNYAIYFPDTGMWAYMDHNATDPGGQHVYLLQNPPVYGRATMYVIVNQYGQFLQPERTWMWICNKQHVFSLRSLLHANYCRNLAAAPAASLERRWRRPAVLRQCKASGADN
jgi:hypothetical protein